MRGRDVALVSRRALEFALNLLNLALNGGISLYALSKLVLYLLLLEKVWAVHGLASLGHRNRCACPPWTPRRVR